MLLTIVDRHLIRAVLTGTGTVVLLLSVLGVLSVFIGQQDDIGIGRFTSGDALLHALYNAPAQVVDFLPAGALIGTLLGVGQLARGSELIVLRTSGLSVWRLARSVSIAAVILSGLGLLIGELLAPQTQSIARQTKLFLKHPEVSLAGRSGAWIRDRNRLVNIEGQSGSGRFLGIVIYELNDEGRLSRISRAASATVATDGRWRLGNQVETTISPDQVRSSRSIETQMNLDIDPAVLGIATLDLALARSDALIDLIQRSETNGVDAEEARLVLWSRLARTLAVVLGPLLGLSFLFGPLRSSGAGANILVGAGIGLMLFTLQGIATSLARLDGGPLPALTLLPPALMGAIAVAMLSRTG